MMRTSVINRKLCWNPPCGCRNSEKKLKLCSGCTVALYCSKECQKEHYPKHKRCCKYAKALLATCVSDGLATKMSVCGGDMTTATATETATTTTI